MLAQELDLSTCTVAELVRDAQIGDRAAFGELFSRYRTTVLALARRRINNADEAEELAQDVFLQAMEKIDQLRVPEAFGGWLRQIVHRMAINRLTRRGGAIACDPMTLEAAWSDASEPSTFAERNEEAAAVKSGLGRLGNLDRQTLEAFYLSGQSLLEMSDAFAAPVGTIKRRLHVARKRLAEEVDQLQAV